MELVCRDGVIGAEAQKRMAANMFGVNAKSLNEGGKQPPTPSSRREVNDQTSHSIHQQSKWGLISCQE